MGERLTTLLPRIGWGAILAAAALVPIAFTRSLADPFSLPKATVWWVAAILAAAGMVADGAARRCWPVPRIRIALPLGLLVGWTVVATALSPQVQVSALGQYGRYDGLASLLAGAVVALAVVASTQDDPDRLVPLVWATLVGGAISLVVVVFQALGWAWTGWGGSVEGGDVVGLVGNGNFSGAVLALVVPLALAVRVTVSARWARNALIGGAIGLVAGVALTETRGGLLALFAGVAVLGVLAPELLPKAVRVGAIVALVLALGLIVAGSLGEQRPSTATGIDSVLARSSLRERQNVWAGAARMVGESPLVGVGPDAFGLRFPEVRSSRADGRALISADEAHDVYLDRAATAGLPAAAAYLWLAGAVVVLAWRARRTVATERRWLLGAFGGVFAGYLVQGVFSIDMVPLAFLAWTSIGALTTLADPAIGASGERARPEPRPLPVGAAVGIAAVGLVAAAVVLRPVAADHRARSGASAAARDEPLVAYGDYASAASWLAHEPRYRSLGASSLVAAAVADGTDPDLRSSLLDEALLAYDQALERAAGDVPIRRAVAETHVLAARAAADPTTAADHLDAAIAGYRSLFDDVRAGDDLHLGLARAYEARADLSTGAAARRDRDRAMDQYAAARRYLPDRRVATESWARMLAEDGELERARALLIDLRKGVDPDPRLDAAIEEIDRRIEAAG